MKINKKLLIPVFATAMGLSVVGGISGAVAWYQYNTKVNASWIGVTTADGGVLQVRQDGGDWKRDLDFGSATTKLHPVSYGALGSTEALSGTPYKHPECGVTDPTEWDPADENVDYHQFTFEIRAQKLVNKAYTDVPASIKLNKFLLGSVTNADVDVADAVRVHISANGTNKLLSLNGGTIQTHGALDLDGDDAADTKGGWQWESGRTAELDYGAGSQTSIALAEDMDLFNIPAGGTTVTVTIWLEGWEILHGESMAMWNPTTDDAVSIRFGMELATESDTFLAD